MTRAVRKSRAVVLIAALFAAIFVYGCRTTLPGGAPVTGVQAATGEAALAELLRRADAFSGERALVKMRVTTGGETRSFRAQLVVHDRQRMELLVYTPVGTTAATITATGDRVTVQNNLENTRFEGDASQLLGSYGFFTGGLTPAEMGMLILGLPPRRDLPYVMTAQGIASVAAGDVSVAFDPAVFPPSHLEIRHGADVVEIDLLEVVGGS